MIYTGYFENNKDIPSSVVRISIAAMHSRRYEGAIYNKLTPLNWISTKYKHTKDIDMFTIQYTEQLEKLTPETIYKELYDLSDGADLVLISFKSSETKYYMSLIRKWFKKNNIDSIEWGVESNEQE